MRLFGFICGVVLLISACSEGLTKQDNTEFLELYSSLIEDLREGHVKLRKYVIKGDIKDTLMIDSVNWQKELKLFLTSNISKSNFDDYEIKVSPDGCEKYFRTKNNKHEVKNYHYSTCNNELVVYIDVEKANSLYNFQYHLELNNEGYLIETKSEVEMAYNSNYRIEGKFISK